MHIYAFGPRLNLSPFLIYSPLYLHLPLCILIYFHSFDQSSDHLLLPSLYRLSVTHRLISYSVLYLSFNPSPCSFVPPFVIKSVELHCYLCPASFACGTRHSPAAHFLISTSILLLYCSTNFHSLSNQTCDC